MKNILLIGARKSSSYVIKYIINKSDEENIVLTIDDINVKNVKKWVHQSKNEKIIKFDFFDVHQRKENIENCKRLFKLRNTFY